MFVWVALGIIATIAAVVLAGSVSVLVWDLVLSDRDEPESMRSAKLEAYKEIMEAVVTLNRAAVEIGEREFHQEADKLLMNQDTILEDLHSDVSETYQRYYFLLERPVYEAAGDYVDYLMEYHEDGAQIGELLALGGQVGAAMRSDLGLPPLGSEPLGDDRDDP